MVGGAEGILLQLALVLLAAKFGGEVAARFRQPAVVGEILAGILIGPSLFGLVPSFEILDTAERLFAAGSAPDLSQISTVMDLHVLAVLAELGVLILLFEVGLESNLREFRRVGWSAGLVGGYGVLFSLVVGAVASYAIATRFDWIITDAARAQPHLLHIFIGATLAATSVGITARVLTDMGRIRTREAQIILGAAVFDDVLGLIVLAIVGGLVVDPGSLSAFGVASVFAKALGFFFVAILFGVILAPRLLAFVDRRLTTPYAHFGVSVVYMLFVSYVATWVGLAAIVGAFAAGLSMSGSPQRHHIFEHVKTVGSLFVGVFFVVLGVRVDVSHVTSSTLPLIVLIGGLLTVVGILAKLACGWGVVRAKASRYVVGVGMVPRGEVGLIFALFGLDHGLLDNWQYTTIIVVVLLTTIITPFWLKSLRDRFHELSTAPSAAVLADDTEP